MKGRDEGFFEARVVLLVKGGLIYFYYVGFAQTPHPALGRKRRSFGLRLGEVLLLHLSKPLQWLELVKSCEVIPVINTIDDI